MTHHGVTAQLNYEEDLRIDQHSLDKEWLEYPLKLMRWSEQGVLAREKLDTAKAKLDVVRAEADSDIRQNPGKYGLEKVTEAAVTAAIPKLETYADALDAVNAARTTADFISAGVCALEQKGAALVNLGKLFLANYWAPAGGPGAPRSPAEIRDRLRRELNPEEEG